MPGEGPDEPEPYEAESLRLKVYRSGRFLVARQLLGMAVKIVGILAVTRLIGPEAYGLFAAAAAVGAFLAIIVTFGIDVQLVRAAASLSAEHTAFTVLLGGALLVGGVAMVAAPVLGSWMQIDAAIAPMRVVAGLLPIMVAGVPARARLERDLRFGPLAAADVAADLTVYAVSLPLAVAGLGVWAPIGGFVARHVVLVAALFSLSGYRPRLRLDRRDLKALGRFGSGYSAGKWMSALGQLVNPIVVGRLVGPIGVGHVALAGRIIEQLGVVKQATVRLATAAFAKLDADSQRLSVGYAEGTLIQVIGAVPLYAAAAFAAPTIFPVVFGPGWEPVAELVGLLAIAASIGTLFSLGPPLLRVLGRNAPVAKLRAWQFGLVLMITLLTVPSVGIAGYGLARIGRTAPFVLVHRELRGSFNPSVREGARWVVALLPMMTAAWWPEPLRPLLLLGPAALLLSATARKDLAQVIRQVIRSSGRRSFGKRDDGSDHRDQKG